MYSIAMKIANPWQEFSIFYVNSDLSFVLKLLLFHSLFHLCYAQLEINFVYTFLVNEIIKFRPLQVKGSTIT